MQSARRMRASKPTRRGERPPDSRERLKLREEGPLSHEPEMESFVHFLQLYLLFATIRWWWRNRTDFFAAGNLSIYYPTVSPRTRRTVRRKLAFRGPDFFIVLGAKPKPNRNSWVVQNEGGKYPNVIVEILSKSTRATDRGKKKSIYEKIFKTPELFLFDPETLTIEGYRLVRGRYIAIQADAQGRLYSEQLDMLFGLSDDRLRLFTAQGQLVPIPEEAALAATARVQHEAERAEHETERAAREAERAAREAARAEQAEHRAAQAEQETLRAEQEKLRALQENVLLAAKLRELGIDPDKLT